MTNKTRCNEVSRGGWKGKVERKKIEKRKKISLRVVHQANTPVLLFHQSIYIVPNPKALPYKSLTIVKDNKTNQRQRRAL